MSKRFELRVDSDEFRAWQASARAEGLTVSEYLRRLAREREQRPADDAIVLAMASRASEPKVT